MTYFKIGNTDFSHLVSGLKVDYETLVADTSGRNAKGDMTIDVINHKYKISATFIPMSGENLKSIMTAINNYVCTVAFYDINTNTVITKSCYTSTPSVEWKYLQDGRVLTKNFTINFIEL